VSGLRGDAIVRLCAVGWLTLFCAPYRDMVVMRTIIGGSFTPLNPLEDTAGRPPMCATAVTTTRADGAECAWGQLWMTAPVPEPTALRYAAP
jgi:hypothetical protein